MNYFGILSPTLGLKQDFPSVLLADAFAPEMVNVRMSDGEVHRVRGRKLLVSALDSGGDAIGEILKYHRHVSSTGAAMLLCATANQLYKLNTAGKWAKCLKAGIFLTDTTEWSFAGFGDYLICTNGLDKVLYATQATDFDWLGGGAGIEVEPGVYLTRARFVSVFENYILLGDVTETAHLPMRLRWSAIGDLFSWKSGDAGYVDLADPSALVAARLYRDNLALFKQESIHRLWLTGGDLVFNTAAMTTEFGCSSPESIVTAPRGELLFFAGDKTIRDLAGREYSRSISPALRNVLDESIPRIRAVRVDQNGELWFALAEESDLNNRVYALKDLTAWSRIDRPVTAFGTHSNTDRYEIDDDWDGVTIDTWSEHGLETIDSAGFNAGLPLLVCGDAQGKTYDALGDTLDDGTGFFGHIVLSTSFAEHPDLIRYKRLYSVRVYARGEDGGTLRIEYKTGTAWRLVGTMDLTGSGILSADLPCDLRSREFQFRVRATNAFRLIGLVFQFTYDGTV